MRPFCPSSSPRLAAVAALAALVALASPAVAQDAVQDAVEEVDDAEPGDRGADKGVFGLGLIIGEPTGLSAKYYLADDTAIDAAVGGAVVGRGIQVHADFLWHPWILERKEGFVLPAYVGLGARVLQRDAGGGDDDHTRIGLRLPVGILFDFTRVPLDAFVEVVGVLDYRTKINNFGLFLNAGAGVRYYF